MYSIEIDYKDFFNNNEQRTEKMYFNLNAFEFAELAVDFDGPKGFAEFMRKAFETADEENYKEGFKALKMLFVASYGRRQPGSDGRDRFIKKPEWIQELLPSPEFEAVFLKLSSDAKFAAAFWNGLVSQELLARAEQIQSGEVVKPEDVAVDDAKPKKFRDMSPEEQLKAMREKIDAKGIDLDEE